ncbi:temptin-like [Pecten maximus]|uniref:temptin-like n=1 Tax=Pecten maximus TaxID=6579 RepID=UPI001458E64A|nr:temptin-like [Pecten maximus]
MLMHTAFLVITCIACVLSFATYTVRIPNGENVTYTNCNNEEIVWQQVGHVANEHIQGDPFDRNAFGKAFYNANRAWTVQLCSDDSDGDGISNGEELGFPSCSSSDVMKWHTKPESVLLTKPSGHPGICEPNEKTPIDVDCDFQNQNIPAAICPSTATANTAP